MSSTFNRILGTLVGVAVGDAMGMPAEMWSQKRIRNYFGEIADFIQSPLENEISGGFRAYETTDDSIVTMLVAQMLIETEGNPNPLDLVNKIQNWAKENPKSKTVIGPSTKRAFEQIAAGVPYSEAGKYGDTNGAAMRISPVGIIYDYKKIEELTKIVSEVCIATHNTNVAISGASAVAAAVSHGIGGNEDMEEMLETARSAAEYGMKYGNDICSASVAEKIKFAAELSNDIADDMEFLYKVYSLIGSGLPSSESVPAAIAIAYRANGDILKCARLCANIGGDTDTIGAMACGICGAHIGIENIPATVVKKITEVNNFPFVETAIGLERVRYNCNQVGAITM